MASVTWSVVALLVIVDGINVVIGCHYGISRACPGKSCLDIYQKNSKSHGVSGKYVIKVGSHYRFVYCDMTLECGGEKGWMRIADVDVDRGDSCPKGWKRITSPTRACRAASDNAGCYSARFTTYNIPYSRVCGMVVGYQKGTPDGFFSHVRKTSINDPYLDGVSITYGSSRKHIWSYAAGLSESLNHDQAAACPCSLRGGTPAPSFVRDHYYCESGTVINRYKYEVYYKNDLLWDGKGCSTNSSCCAQPSLPWFYRQIPLTSKDKLEARICCDEPYANEAVLVKEFKLYVQ